jgi:hypothetical protein
VEQYEESLLVILYRRGEVDGAAQRLVVDGPSVRIPVFAGTWEVEDPSG